MLNKLALAISLLVVAVLGSLFYYSGGRLSGIAELMFGLFVMVAAFVFLVSKLVRGRRSYI